MISCAATAFEAADQIDEAIRVVREGVRQIPASESLRSKLAFLLNYSAIPRDELFRTHTDYRDHVVRANASAPKPESDPDRQLRIGLLSGDLRTHSVAFFADAIVHTKPARDTFTIFATLPTSAADPLTQRFRARADAWIESSILDDDGLDRAIRDARIDVLIDLSGHTHGGRLSALDRKPAPVIVSAIGYPNTTGHPAVDWRLVDSTTDPEGSERYATERLLRIDPCFLCYTPPEIAPEPTRADDGAPITFGSFNLTSKVTPTTIALWKSVLDAVPQSRLLVKSKSIADESTKRSVLARLASGGIDPARVETLAYTKSQAEHFALYSRVHVALDTTPYNGTTTTCEALWMGVPVVTLEGDRHAARVGASLLRAADCAEWVAPTPDAFVSIASSLARDRARLAQFRQSARTYLRRSALLNVDAYGARLHSALRTAWREWCSAQ